MADNRFFHNAGPQTLQDIATLTGAKLASSGGNTPDGARVFSDVAPLERAGENDVSFLDNIKYASVFATSQAGACFVREKHVAKAPAGMALLVTDEPYYAYAVAAQKFYPESKVEAEIAASAVVAKSAKIGKGSRIDSGAVISENAIIGERCHIGANTVIGQGVEIGNDCRIGALCSVSHTTIGKRIIVHRGVHIGQDGFGFAPGPKGIVKVPQLGRVLISDDVEIGSGTCIDRGTGPDTLIGSFTKIDNLVQIGHNVQIGKYVVIAAHAGISGSTHIGDGVMIGGQVGFAGHLKIGAGAKLAAQSGVMTDVPPGDTYGGSPAIPVRDWHRQTVAVAKIAKKGE